MLSDNYDARVLAKNNNVEPVSVHRLLFSTTTAGVISDVEAADFADALAPKSCAPARTFGRQAGRTGKGRQPAPHPLTPPPMLHTMATPPPGQGHDQTR